MKVYVVKEGGGRELVTQNADDLKLEGDVVIASKSGKIAATIPAKGYVVVVEE